MPTCRMKYRLFFSLLCISNRCCGLKYFKLNGNCVNNDLVILKDKITLSAVLLKDHRSNCFSVGG